VSIVIHGYGNLQGYVYCCCGGPTYYGVKNLQIYEFASVLGYTLQPGDRVVVAYWADAYPTYWLNLDVFGNFTLFDKYRPLYSDTYDWHTNTFTYQPGWSWWISTVDNSSHGAPYGESYIQVMNNSDAVTRSLMHWWIIRGADANPFVSFSRVTPTLSSVDFKATLSITTPNDNCCVLGVSYPDTVGPYNGTDYFGTITNTGNKWNYTANGLDAATNIGLRTDSGIGPTTTSFFHTNLGPAGIKTATLTSANSNASSAIPATVDYIILKSAPTKTLTTMN
jgi:hypothetical protein